MNSVYELNDTKTAIAKAGSQWQPCTVVRGPVVGHSMLWFAGTRYVRTSVVQKVEQL